MDYHLSNEKPFYARYLTGNMALEERISIFCHPVIGVESSVIDRKIWGQKGKILLYNHINLTIY